MKLTRNTLISILSLSVATPAMAGNNDFVRGVIGGAILLNELSKRDRNNRAGNENRNYRDNGSQPTNRRAEARELRKEVQRRLNVLGFDAGVPDGIYGPQSRQAIARFQSSIGRAPDGKISREEIAILYEQSNGISGGQTLPPVGTGDAGSTTAASGAFPPIGAGTSEGETATAFPALAAPGGADSNGSGANAFPQIGTPEAGAPAKPAFPVIGSVDPKPAEEPAMPELGKLQKKEGEAQSMPELASSGPDADETLTASSLSDELAKTVYGDKDEQPAVLGIKLGFTGDVEKSLVEQGFAGCISAGALTCNRETSTLEDSISVWTNDADGVWAISRKIAFREGAPANIISKKFRSSYPELMQSPDYLISTGNFCNIRDFGGDLAELLSRRPADETQAMSADLVQLSQRCQLAYSIQMGVDGDKVSEVTVLFVDGTGIMRQHVALIEKERMEAEAHENKLAEDLKL